MKTKILTLNNISAAGLDRLPVDRYEMASEFIAPDAIMLRSMNLHDFDFPDSVKAVGRAGAGVNNIPVDKLTTAGIPVFNAPGANANAVKELVIASMLLGCRNICQAQTYTNALEGEPAELSKAVEAGKKQFGGFELPGRTLGVIGLGAIGVQVANAALALGMKVIGFDPGMTVSRAWQLSSNVMQGLSVDEVMAESDFVTFHVPLIEATRDLINAERLQLMKDNVVIMNFARGGIVNDADVMAAMDSGKVYAYITDFPTAETIAHPRVVTLPHLGASTVEAEDNCAMMIADQLRDFLEHGNITNSVNFPGIKLKRKGAYRLSIVHDNAPDMVGQVSRTLGEQALNIVHMRNESRGEIAYTLLDFDGAVSADLMGTLEAIEGVKRVRLL
ncbi:MAG: 3-phosphoglycerate dehydrogenase family protein [bacterium]